MVKPARGGNQTPFPLALENRLRVPRKGPGDGPQTLLPKPAIGRLANLWKSLVNYSSPLDTIKSLLYLLCAVPSLLEN